MQTAKLTAKCQVTIPKAVCELAGLSAHTEVEITVVDGEVRIVKVRDEREGTRGARAVAALRRGAKSAGAAAMTTDEIMELTRGKS